MHNGNAGDADSHPLASDQSTLALIARLPLDSGQALVDLGGWLDALQDLPELKLPRKFSVIDMVDRTARDHLDRFTFEYLAAGSVSYDADDPRPEPAAATFSMLLARAYQHAIMLFQSYSAGWNEVRDRIPLLVGRALRASALRLKWQLMRYAPVERDMWFTLYQLWAFAEDRGFNAARIEMFVDEESTVQREFLKPLMLAVSAADSLRPEEIAAAEKIIARFAERYDLQRHPAKKYHFFVDIDADKPPARHLLGGRVRPGVRFFGPGNAVPQLDSLSSTIATEGAVPAELGLRGENDLELVIDVLGHLSRHWLARRAGRRDERRQLTSAIGVVRGFDEIVAKLSDYGVLDLSLEDAIESWPVENESESGYGAVLLESESEWARVGAILGVKAPESQIWAVGIVRRIAAREDNQRYIGIQLLAKAARIVSLRIAEENGGTQTAILLPSHVGDSVSQGEVSILLPAKSFSSEYNFEMQVYQHAYLLEPRMLLESESDFELAYFRILQRIT